MVSVLWLLANNKRAKRLASVERRWNVLYVVEVRVRLAVYRSGLAVRWWIIWWDLVDSVGDAR